MKIALIMSLMTLKGGAQNTAVWLASEMSLLGHKVEIFTDRYDPGLWPQYEGKVTVKEFELARLNKAYPAEWKKAGETVLEALQSFDIINPHVFPTPIWVSRVFWGQLSNKMPQVVWYCHELPHSLYGCITDPLSAARFGYLDNPGLEPLRSVDRWAVSLAGGVLANSSFTAANVKKVYGRESRVCYPGVPDQKLQKQEKKCFRVLTRLSREKNVDTIIQAMALLKKSRNPDICLQVAGVGPEYSRLKETVGRLGLFNVQMMGFLPDHLLPRFYAGARAMIYTPLDEPFGLVPLEAGMQKTPVIGSNQGGLAETVIDGVTGIAVDPLDPQALAGAISRLASRPGLAERMGDANYDMVRQKFTAGLFARRYSEMMAALTVKKPPAK